MPHTDHVHIDVPKGLQHWLDADTRMQPWVNKVVSVADGCYERGAQGQPKAAGVDPVKITMHENERPDADVGSVPSSTRRSDRVRDEASCWARARRCSPAKKANRIP